MVRSKQFLVLILSGLSMLNVRSQGSGVTTKYINPMDIPLQLSGNFMEPRSNHFHSGLDMRTDGREGVPVRAVADGWVSRIKISPWGYGKAIYIEHPDGRTSVYGHLSELKGAVAQACLAAQYKAKDFSVDISPEAGSIPLKQGEVFALSGNSGGSGGPHLHFELRNSAQHALDPQALGIIVKDTTHPEIIGIRIYPLTDSSRVAPYPARSLGYPAQGALGRYTLKPGALPEAYGTVGIAVHTIDRYDGSGAKFGVRSIELFVDSVPTFSTRFDMIDFNTTRYCNAQVDFSLFKENKMEYHRCFKLPNNKLQIYGNGTAHGRVPLAAGKDHHVRLQVTDANGNVSQLVFFMHGATASESVAWPTTTPIGSLMRYDSDNVMSEEGVRLEIPAMSLYEDAYVHYERKPKTARSLTDIHVLHDPLTPIHSHCELSLDLPKGYPEKLGRYALIVSLDSEGRPSAEGGRYIDGKLVVKVRSFGTYTTMLDTVPPVIKNVDLKQDMAGRKEFRIRISDDLSGIGNYTAKMNGEWILMEQDPKTKSLTHVFDTHTTGTGSKEFKLEVADERGNLSKFELTFVR